MSVLPPICLIKPNPLSKTSLQTKPKYKAFLSSRLKSGGVVVVGYLLLLTESIFALLRDSLESIEPVILRLRRRENGEGGGGGIDEDALGMGGGAGGLGAGFKFLFGAIPRARSNSSGKPTLRRMYCSSVIFVNGLCLTSWPWVAR